MPPPVGDWYKDAKNIKGFLLDIFGCLYDSGDAGDEVIYGSVEAIEKLRCAGVPFRLCSNTSELTRENVIKNLQNLGFHVEIDQLFTPAPAICHYIEQNNLRPYFVINPTIAGEFAGCNTDNPNCVVLGDAQHQFTYEKINKAFQLLFSNKEAPLLTMGAGKYYMETDGLKLDVGAYAKILEYACDIKAMVFGKPNESFFLAALESMQLRPENVIFII